ncbi:MULTISPECIES: hypothetical protein [Streptomyces]|uniref:SH3 domain-containing protein n=1 Tax=Streptomyces cyaneofuscatus TaxID=66883 RepID=A0ABZ1EQ81_9ACTN|nr:hypothetical protein [Streptomyces cyaneofuscatus]WSB06267.1 hypothetical protein OG849_03000 [Streptomyces cyaneofuscatus]WSD50199.1 hypothetical protein OG857_32395 [Streptomyces cyaneofuscatus]WTA93697.1 hypothetical protein OG323_34050 [Streptomyces cyaneofuscatus]
MDRHMGVDVNVRADSTTTSRKLTALPAGAEVLVLRQQRGQEVSVRPHTNDRWAYLPQYAVTSPTST